jgi:hypothetical protein
MNGARGRKRGPEGTAAERRPERAVSVGRLAGPHANEVKR